MTQDLKSAKHIRFLRKPFQIIRANFRAYLTINAIVYGSVIAGMVAATVFPNLGAAQVATLEAKRNEWSCSIAPQKPLAVLADHPGSQRHDWRTVDRASFIDRSLRWHRPIHI